MADATIKKVTVFRLLVDSVDGVSLPKYHLVKSATAKLDKSEFPYRLHFLSQPPRQADWYSVFIPLDLKLESKRIPKTMVSGFVLLVKVGQAIYAVTGGIGHVHLKNATKVEHRFGIELAQRILSLPELRGLSQKDTTGSVVALDRVFRGVYNPIGDMNNLKRVLKLVRGKLGKKSPYFVSIGRSIQATDALSVNGSKTFADIIAFLVEVENLWDNGSKQIDIPQLAHIDKKSNGPLLDELEGRLVQTLCDYSSDATFNLFLDNEDIGYLPDRVTEYELVYDRKKYEAETYDGVFEHVKNLFAKIAKASERLAEYRRMHLHVKFDDGFYEKRTLAYFVCGDVVHNNDVYFITNELWYRASDDFLKRIESELDNIECVEPSSVKLIDWDVSKFHGKDAEKDFNKAHTTHVVMDRRLVKIPEEKGDIEFCDLLDDTGSTVRLLHVKHSCGAELRALFAQGFVSAKLYADSDEFRKRVHEADFVGNGAAIAKAARRRLKGLSKRRKREFVVVYAIFDDTQSHVVPPDANSTTKALNGTLTTFAKVDLVERARSIREMGYGIAVTRIKPYPKGKGHK